MPDISYEFLTRFFQQHLPFLPNPGHVSDFQADLRLVSPFLLEASMVEVRAGTQGYLLVYRPDEWRPAIFNVYNRKIAEHGQLFPIFHSFETAFRSTTAVVLEQHYAHQRWWRAIYERVIERRSAKEITHIGTVAVTRHAAFRIGQIIKDLEGPNLDRGVIEHIDNGYEFLLCCDLAHTRQLIEEHWSVFGPMLRPLTLADFSAKFDRVREARNTVYHHKSLSGMSDVVAAAEELLDGIDFSLQFVCEKISACSPAAPYFNIPIAVRHRTW